MTTTITPDPEHPIAPVSPRLFGSFVEHMGRCVYTGIVEPGHPTADAAGLRGDVLELTRELGVTVVRYPGGNFVSGYDWEDGIGPIESRPRRLETAWHEIEPNTFGLHEFVDWATKAGVEVMYAVNLGTRGIDAARRVVEYANHRAGTQLSDLRRANGAEEPFGIRLWCLGNEMDGPWQIGAKTAEEYGRLALETAKAMRLVDPTIELVVAGSSAMDMPTFGEWERTVLAHTASVVDYVSIHAYYEEHDGRPEEFLAAPDRLDAYISTVLEIVDEVVAAQGLDKRIDLALDEWNVWYMARYNDPEEKKRVEASEWTEHPRVIEDEYNVTDAVVVGMLLHTLLRRSDRVTIANLAQLVNVIAPIRTEEAGPAWRQTTFFPFARIAEHARGEVLTTRVDGSASIDAISTRDAASHTMSVFVANRSLTDSTEVTLDLPAGATIRSAEILAAPEGGDRFSSNALDQPERVGLRPLSVDGRTVVLPPVSWAVVLVDLG
jgi:alpha-N-arabinofuranosidase